MTQSIRILHLEDTQQDAELISQMLGNAHVFCNTVWVRGKADFESMVAQSSFDLILCDYNLPGYNGLSALKFLRSKGIETPVIIISGVLGEEDAVECLKNGATDYLLKQRLGRLPSAVTRALELADEQIQRKRAEMALRESERLVRAMLDALPSPIGVLDERGQVVAENKAWRECAKICPSRWLCLDLGLDYLEACEKAAAQGDEGALRVARGAREIFACRTSEFTAEVRISTAAGDKWFFCRLNRFPGEGPVRVAVTHMDISAVKQMQDPSPRGRTASDKGP